MSVTPYPQRWRLRSESLPTHGAGPYHALSFRRGTWGPGVRISRGAYGWRRPWYAITLKRWPMSATHLTLGAWCLSIIHHRAGRNLLPFIDWASTRRQVRRR